jgi:hypothetical protein
VTVPADPDNDAWRRGYIYVADESGNEVPGSRRSLTRCKSIDDARRLWLELEAKAGDGCVVKHSDDG